MIGRTGRWASSGQSVLSFYQKHLGLALKLCVLRQISGRQVCGAHAHCLLCIPAAMNCVAVASNTYVRLLVPIFRLAHDRRVRALDLLLPQAPMKCVYSIILLWPFHAVIGQPMMQVHGSGTTNPSKCFWQIVSLWRPTCLTCVYGVH